MTTDRSRSLLTSLVHRLLRSEVVEPVLSEGESVHGSLTDRA